MFVTWGNTAVDKAGTIDSSTTLKIDMDLRLYALGIDSSSGNVIDATGDAPQTMEFYLQFLNPYMTTTGNSQGYSTVQYDAVVGYLDITTNRGPPHTAVFTWAAGGIADAKCTDPTWGNAGANCSVDALNAYTTTTTGEQCVQKWSLANQEIRCVQIKNTFSRPFLTTDTNAVDFDLGYRPFQVLAGWEIADQLSASLKLDFTAQAVDFGRFLRPTPEADYNGAVSSLSLTCGLVAGVLAYMF